MIEEKKRPGMGRGIAGCVLGAVLAYVSPLALLTELTSLLPVIMLPSVGLALIYRWAGRGPALFSGMMMLMFDAAYFGSTFMWAAFFMTLMPLTAVIRMQRAPFGAQMRAAVAMFTAGLIAGVAALCAGYGGNMIERMLQALPEAIRALPQEKLAMLLESVSVMLGRTLRVEEFYAYIEGMLDGLLPYYELNLPGLLFSGALLSAVLCVGAGNLLRRRMGEADEALCPPLREWALPANTTGGIVLMLAASYLLEWLNLRGGQAARIAVYDVMLTAFCIQAFASIARRMHASAMPHGLKLSLCTAAALLALLGGAEIVALYGSFSAISGSRGAIRQRMRRDGSGGDKSNGQ